MQRCSDAGAKVAVPVFEFMPGLKIGIVEDPDGNSVEVYWPTGIDVPQPFGKPMDLTKSEEEILARVKQLVAENKL